MWSPPPVKSLTPAAVESVLYIMSPAGRSQLTVELHRRGYVFTGEELIATLGQVIKDSKASVVHHGDVEMYALRGLSR